MDAGIAGHGAAVPFARDDDTVFGRIDIHEHHLIGVEPTPELFGGQRDDVVRAVQRLEGVGEREQERLAGLALAQNLFRLLAGGDVGGGAEPFPDLASLVEQRGRARQDPADATVGAQDAMLQLEKALAPDGLGDRRVEARPFVRGNERVAPGLARRLDAGEKALGRQLAHLSPVRAHPVDNAGRGFGERAEAGFAFPKRLFRLLALGDVGGHADDSDNGAGRVAPRLHIEIVGLDRPAGRCGLDFGANGFRPWR